MHDEEAEAIANREILEGDGTMEALRGDLFSPMFLGDDRGSVFLREGDLKRFIAGLRMPNDAVIRDGERYQKI